MKVANAPDLHIPDKRTSPEWHAKGIASLTTLVETVERERPALVTFPGDLYHGGIQNSEAAGFPAFLRLIRRILDICPIAAVSGTGSHDPPGAYKALTALKAKHPFIYLDPAEMSPPVAWICEDGKVEVEIWSKENPVSDGHTAKLLIMGLPEPSKEWLLADAQVAPEDAGAALREGLRRILLGFGALRAQYPDIPCVFLFHGAFSGATMQNGQTVGPGEIQIGREDLQLIAPDITARYGGNGYPKEWGELGQVGFDMVDLQPGDTFGSLGHIHLAQEVVHGREIAVTRFNYPHPPRAKFTVDWPEPVGEAMVGVQAWICYRATKEKVKEIDTTSYLNSYLLAGALPGSRVTVEQIYEVKAGLPQIADLHTLREKIQLKAEADGKPVGETILQKADQLEREAEERGELQQTSVIVKKLKLRGSKAVYKGRRLLRQLLNLPELPVDNLELDFEKLDPGVVALIGDTGTGKTSIYRFLAPFTDMPGRRGPLRNHFRLRDSSWELTFLEEYSGVEFRVLCLIDGVNKDGKCEYYLYRNGEPLTRGRLAEYDEAVKRYFGTPELFVRCTLVVQKPTKDNPDLSEATKGERQAVVRELSGIGYYQGYSENAKGKGDAIENAVSAEQDLVNVWEQQLRALPGFHADRAARASDLDERQGSLRTQELRGLSLKSDADQLAEKVKAQELLQQKIVGLEDQAAQKRQAIATAEELIAGYQAAVQQAPGAQKVVDSWTELKEKENAENGRLSAVNAERARLQGEHNARLEAHHQDVRKLESQQAELRTKRASLEGDRNVLQAQIANLKATLQKPINPICPDCGQKGHADDCASLTKLREERAQNETKLASFETKQADCETAATKKDTELAEIVLPPVPPEPTLPPVDEEPLQLIRKSLAALNVEHARKSLATAQEAATRTEETRKQLSVAQNGLSILEINLKSAQDGLDPAIAKAHEEAQAKLEAARAQYQEAAKAIAGLEAELKALDARITELEEQARDLEERKTTIAASRFELTEWRFLQEICGPNGLQAEELRLIGPKIAETSNSLLSSVFGSRFSVEYRLDRMAGRGKDLREVPDFAIWIIDNEDGGSEQEFVTLSGGESVPVNLAIHLAFVKIRKQKFSPMLLDEADGALSPRLRAGYVEMIEHARTEAGLKNIMVVSHDVGVQEAISQKIVMSELAKQEVAR